MTTTAEPHVDQGLEDLGISARGSGPMQVLTFMVDGEEYAVDIRQVQEIRGWQGAMPLPNVPSYLRGVIEFRGSMVPIVDLRDRFQLERREYGPTTVNILLRVEGDDEARRSVGIVVDAVNEVHDLQPGSVQPAPDLGRTIDVDYVAGIAAVEGKMLIVLDPAWLLDHRQPERSEGDHRRSTEATPTWREDIRDR